jgi:acyl carrier protein phosphodiesterase
MNFLAHLFLSGKNEELMVGNLLGDFMRGRKQEAFSEGVAKGICLHRKIDEFTDNHPLVTESKLRLRPAFKHYAPVVADVFYDHFLAANFSDYSDVSLKDFAQRCYNVLRMHKDLFPPRFQQALIYMRFRNVLVSYSKMNGIEFAFARMSRRTNHISNLHNATKELHKNYDHYYSEFKIFFPELCIYTKGLLDSL